jgi:hypothetical protein
MERVLLPPVRVHHKINSEIQKRAPLKRIGKVLGRTYRPYAASDPEATLHAGGSGAQAHALHTQLQQNCDSDPLDLQEFRS